MSEWIRKDEVLKQIYDLSDITTADVVEVVRCKDCMYHYPPFEDCCSVDYVCEDNDFCSWGERREDGTT